MAIRPGVNSTLNFKKYKTEFYRNYNNSKNQKIRNEKNSLKIEKLKLKYC